MSYNKETGMYEGYIYKIYNDLNDKIYIGQTAIDVKTRWKQHLSKTAHKEDNSIIHKAIEKYGEEHFTIEIIETIYNNNSKSLRKDLNKKEMSWIKQYNSISPYGYNILYGGGDIPIKKITVYQFDLEGKFIMEFDSISNALRYLNKNPKSYAIQSSIKKSKSAFGFLWSYSKEDNPYKSYKENTKRIGKYQSPCNGMVKGVPINQYTTDDIFVASYGGIFIAAKEFGENANKPICNCCKKRTKTSYGYKWFYADDPNQPDKTRILTNC